ncbi:hypothetical protein TL16_g09745 [Triparma laevis f. inornata]|uniref:Uncharacterized protein n=1 Tax=Triparma laevis f. inornata TaxID=1714386 RepID=A0A9W7ENM8_9STRA|nr:hypothetical protein TL16_g09745 [Triparma laevis f. inornata]
MTAAENDAYSMGSQLCSPPSALIKRFRTSAEVTVSKIFPAGFGWQTASIVADSAGFEADTINFALSTGTGDGVGVFVGHTAYHAAKKAATGSSSINMKAEAQTGFLLASAAFCSGTGWKPIVNCLQDMNLPFASVMAGTWVGCGTLFYFGLRGGRTLFSSMEHIEEPTYENSKNDTSLSVAIGGATGFFVGTDAAYLPDQNFLINVVGIADGTPDLTGCAIAGSSTALGFATTQSMFNVTFPSNKLLND